MSKEHLVVWCATVPEMQTAMATAGSNEWQVTDRTLWEGGVLLWMERDDVAAKLSKNALEGLVGRLDRYAVHNSECARTESRIAVCTCGLQEIRRDVDLVVVPF